MSIIARLILSLWALFTFTTKAYGQQQFSSFAVNNLSSLQGSYNSHAWEGDLIELSPVYQRILTDLNNHYDQLGQRQVDIVNQGNSGLSTIGGLNNIGLSYRKSFIDFNIIVDRQLAPDLFDNERWIVTDEFTIEINASKFISNLKDKEIISISDKNFAAYAGVVFKRKYRYIHFANSYQDGLTTNFDKLFLSFTHFKNKKYLDLDDYEMLQKQDYISFNMGALGSMPIYGPVAIAAGAVAHYEKISNVEIQAIGPDDQSAVGDALRVSYESGKSVLAGANLSLQLDFLKLLKITLLSFDLDYQLTESKKTYLTLKERDLIELEKNKSLARSLDRLINHKGISINELAPYVISYEQRKKEKIKSKYMILTFGGSSSQDTEHIQVVSKNKVKEYFRHNFEKVKIVQNIFSRFVSILFKSFLNMDTLVGNKSRDAKTLRVEYESEYDLIKSKKKLDVSNKKENLSINFNKEYFAQETTGSRGKKHKRNVDLMLADYTNVPSSVLFNLESNFLMGPMTVTNRYQIGKDAINHFNSLGRTKAYQYIGLICKDNSKSIFKFFRSLFGGCKSKLQKRFDRYQTELWHGSYGKSDYKSCKKPRFRFFSSRRKLLAYKRCLMKVTKIKSAKPKAIPLWRMKDFFQKLQVESKTKLDMYNFFGLNNVFMFGHIKATTTQGKVFHSYFNEGKFNGLGVVNNSLQAANHRSPASINIE